MAHSVSRFVTLLVIAVTCACTTADEVTTPSSHAERTTFEETSRYADVRAFIDALASQTARVRVETFGRSEEGRDLPLLVIGDPPAKGPAAQSGSRLPVVLVMANIHAGEVEGKEAVLHLARRMTLGDLQGLLTSAVWLFAPIYNADGNERIRQDHRAEQHGPIGGVGTRENAQGLDLNRDFMKLESSEARALVGLFTTWNPDVIVDLHTTNGSYHGYHLTYAPPLNPNTDAAISSFTRERLLPTVRDAVRARHGFRTYDYGNFATTESLDTSLTDFPEGVTQGKAWRTFDARPRFGTNYGGLRNRIAVLSEAYSYLDFARRVKATEAFTEEVMRFVAANGDTIRSLIDRVDAEWVSAPREQSIAAALRALPAPVDVLVGAIEARTNPRSGKVMKAMVEGVAVPTRMTVYDGFEATASRRVPNTYIVPAGPHGAHEIVRQKLQEHGIPFEQLGTSSRMAVEAFVIARVTRADRLFQGHRETSLAGRFERREIDVPAGSLVVRTQHPRGRLVFYLLEPESNDGLTTWNFLDAALTVGATHPIYKALP